MIQTMKVKLIGRTSLVMHNGQLANPLNEFTKAIAAVSKKRGKTEADFLRMSELEFRGGLYPQNVSNGQGPVIPARCARATLINGAKKHKNGTLFKSAVFVVADAPVQYDGPRTASELFADGRFTFIAPVKVGQSTIMRTRPKFDEWSAVLDIEYDDTDVNKEAIGQALTSGGRLVGALDGRPEYGRFTWEEVAA